MVKIALIYKDVFDRFSTFLYTQRMLGRCNHHSYHDHDDDHDDNKLLISIQLHAIIHIPSKHSPYISVAISRSWSKKKTCF